MANPRRVQCGAPECRRRWQADRTRTWLTEYRETAGVRYEDRYKIDRQCEDCAATIRVQRHASTRLCQLCACRRAARASGAATTAEAAARRALVRVGLPWPRCDLPRQHPVFRRPPKSVRRVWFAGYCVRCGAPFVHDHPQTTTCSPTCAKKLGRHRRRARQRGAFVASVSPRRIFERDRWMCRLCGKRTARAKQVPHPKAPVLDHIVPLAAGPELGGVHAPWNVQCAHFLCNSKKRDLLAQPALF